MGKFKKFMFNIGRKSMVKDITKGLGKCEIFDDKIVCDVSEKKIKKKFNKGSFYFITLGNGGLFDKKLLDFYDLKKPVHYLFNGINFDKKVKLIAPLKRCSVIFNNCSFGDYFMVDQADNVIFDNCNTVLLSVRDKNDVNIIEIMNSHMNFSVLDMETNLYVKASLVKLSNSYLVGSDSFTIESDNLVLEKDSFIDSKDIVIDSRNIDFIYGDVDSDNISISTCSNVDLKDIRSSNVLVNDICFRKNRIDVSEEDVRLQRSNLLLLNELRKIPDELEEIGRKTSHDIDEQIDMFRVEALKRVRRR